MASRYKNTEIDTGRNGNLKHNTNYMPHFPERDTDIHIITTDGDRLDLLARRFYGSVTGWWIIARANDMFSINVKPGTKLRIPGA